MSCGDLPRSGCSKTWYMVHEAALLHCLTPCLGQAHISLGVLGDEPQGNRDVIKLSGVKKQLYLSSYRTVEKLLGLDEVTSTKDLCVLLGVSEASLLAQSIIDSHVAEKSGRPDLTHPMYPSIAVFAACKHLKLKVDRQKLLEQSCLKKSAFDTLAAELMKMAEKVAPQTKRMAKKRTHALMDIMENQIKAQRSTKVVGRAVQLLPPFMETEFEMSNGGRRGMENRCAWTAVCLEFAES
ncbi:unnamed protein product [Timema podura]|uniref:ORC6 second cyclin-like domain-containing protein n=1 Tax=Timema podura TaxID=61482 RepID=A0ABN7P0C2_TIMPD|nr:unnamed protein product [Timema podura]